MRIRTTFQFHDAISSEFAWRRKEILDFRLQTHTKNFELQPLFIRAGVPLLYAHWEGFVKTSTEILLNYICHLNLTNAELTDVFFAHSAKSQIARFIETRRAVNATETAHFLRNCSSLPSEIRHKNYVDTESNLKSDVFDQIASSIGVDTTAYKHLYPYIDETIVQQRNRIAHGESVSLDINDFRAISDRVSDLIAMYKTDVENIVSSSSYKRVP